MRIDGSDRAFEYIDLRRLIGNPHGEFGTLDHAVHVRRVDGHGARRAAERLERADHQFQQRALLRLVRDIDQSHGGVLIEAQNRVIDQTHRRAAVGANPDRITLAERRRQACRAPLTLFGMSDFDRAFERGEATDRAAAILGCRRRQRPEHRQYCQYRQHSRSQLRHRHANVLPEGCLLAPADRVSSCRKPLAQQISIRIVAAQAVVPHFDGMGFSPGLGRLANDCPATVG